MARQCGSRKKGGCYMEIATSPHGMPMEYFLQCPPIVLEFEVRNSLGIEPNGVRVIKYTDGNNHVFDIIGEDNYPNVLDSINEARLLGWSRRCELPDYSGLDHMSKLFLIHRRAYVHNYNEYLSFFSTEESDSFHCPKGHEHHRLNRSNSVLGPLPEMCAGLWAHDLAEGVDFNASLQREMVNRQLECGLSYMGYPRPLLTPEYEYAIFGVFPIGRLVVIEDPEDSTHIKKLERASKSGLDVELVQE
jgi:hypothetical protein